MSATPVRKFFILSIFLSFVSVCLFLPPSTQAQELEERFLGTVSPEPDAEIVPQLEQAEAAVINISELKLGESYEFKDVTVKLMLDESGKAFLEYLQHDGSRNLYRINLDTRVFTFSPTNTTIGYDGANIIVIKPDRMYIILKEGFMFIEKTAIEGGQIVDLTELMHIPGGSKPGGTTSGEEAGAGTPEPH